MAYTLLVFCFGKWKIGNWKCKLQGTNLLCHRYLFERVSIMNTMYELIRCTFTSTKFEYALLIFFVVETALVMDQTKAGFRLRIYSLVLFGKSERWWCQVWRYPSCTAAFFWMMSTIRKPVSSLTGVCMVLYLVDPWTGMVAAVPTMTFILITDAIFSIIVTYLFLKVIHPPSPPPCLPKYHSYRSLILFCLGIVKAGIRSLEGCRRTSRNPCLQAVGKDQALELCGCIVCGHQQYRVILEHDRILHVGRPSWAFSQP